MSSEIDREVIVNRPVIVIKDQPFRKWILNDNVVSSERNTSMQIIEELTGYGE